MMKRTLPWVAAALMLATAAWTQWWRPVAEVHARPDLQAVVPSQFGAWRVDPSILPVAPAPDVQANLDKIYDQIVSRTYVNDRGERVMLVIAYGGDQSDSLKAHRQEVCYAAQGFAIRSVVRDALELGAARVPLVRMHAAKGRRSEPVSYWFTMGDAVVLGRAERLWQQVTHGLAGRVPDGLLLRVSNVSPDVPGSFDLHDRFLRELLRDVDADTRARLAGVAARGAVAARVARPAPARRGS